MNLDRDPQVYYLEYIKSQYNEKTWSPSKDITSQMSKPQWHKDFKFINSVRGTQIQKGTLLHTLVNINRGLHIFKIDDYGNSWQMIDTLLFQETNPKC